MLEHFITKITDPEYGVYYMPTTLGFTALAVIMLLLLLLAAALSSGSSKKMKTKELVFCSLAIALAYVTSTFFKLFDLPMGGSVTLFSMLFVTLIGYWYGIRTGLTAAVAYGMLQLVTDPWIISLPQLIFDYFLAFGALGLSGLFKNAKHGLIKGYITGILGRLLFSFLSGILFFASSAAEYNMSAPVYSLLYNGSYIGIEAVATIIVISLPPVSKALSYIKAQSYS